MTEEDAPFVGAVGSYFQQQGVSFHALNVSIFKLTTCGGDFSFKVCLNAANPQHPEDPRVKALCAGSEPPQMGGGGIESRKLFLLSLKEDPATLLRVNVCFLPFCSSFPCSSPSDSGACSPTQVASFVGSDLHKIKDVSPGSVFDGAWDMYFLCRSSDRKERGTGGSSLPCCPFLRLVRCSSSLLPHAPEWVITGPSVFCARARAKAIQQLPDAMEVDEKEQADAGSSGGTPHSYSRRSALSGASRGVGGASTGGSASDLWCKASGFLAEVDKFLHGISREARQALAEEAASVLISFFLFHHV